MAKFSVVADETASEATDCIYKQILNVKHLRFVPNFFKTLANSPAVLEGTWSVYRNISTRGSLSEALKEMIFVAISAAKKCEYCEAAHLAFCRILKVDPETCNNLFKNLDDIHPEPKRDIIGFSVNPRSSPNNLLHQH